MLRDKLRGVTILKLKILVVKTGILTLFVPGFFHVDMTGGALIGRTPQKFYRLTAIIL